MTDVPVEGNEDLLATLSTTDIRLDIVAPEANVTITEESMCVHIHLFIC